MGEVGQIFPGQFYRYYRSIQNCTIKIIRPFISASSRRILRYRLPADEPLIIENNALGYRVQYQLEEIFVSDFKEHAFSSWAVHCLKTWRRTEDVFPNAGRMMARRMPTWVLWCILYAVCMRDLYCWRRIWKHARLLKGNYEKQRVKRIAEHNARSAWRYQDQKVILSMTNVMGDSSKLLPAYCKQPDVKDILACHLDVECRQPGYCNQWFRKMLFSTISICIV